MDTSQATGKPSVLKQWARMARRIDQLTEVVTIALVGKYTGSHDCYHSLNKALDHAAYKADRVLKVGAPVGVKGVGHPLEQRTLTPSVSRCPFSFRSLPSPSPFSPPPG